MVFPWEKRMLEELAERHGVGKLEFEPLEIYMDGLGRCAVALYRWIIRGFCPLYRLASSECTIHFQKPLACRMYPLIVNVENGEIAVSTKCNWVEENISVLKKLRGDVKSLLKVFPEEGMAALEAYIAYRELVSTLREIGLKRVEDSSKCRMLYDADDYVVRFA